MHGMYFMHGKEHNIKGLNKVSAYLLARCLRNCSLPSDEENFLFWRANPSLQYPEEWIPQEEEKRWPNAFQLTELVPCDLNQFFLVSCLVSVWLLIFGVGVFCLFVLFCFASLNYQEAGSWQGAKMQARCQQQQSLMLQHIYARRTHIKDIWAGFF